GRLRPVAGGARFRRRQVERLDVDDDLAASRREHPDERPDRGHVDLAIGPAVDEEHLGATRAVDVADRPQLGAVDAANGRADDLVPEVLAARQLRLGPGDALEVRAAELVGGLAGRDLLEVQAPAGTVADGGRPIHGQRVVAALAVEDAARGLTVLRTVGQDLARGRAVQAVQAANESDDQPLPGDAIRDLVRGDAYRISSETGSPSRAAVTFRSVRSAFATLPFRPITLPMSSSATWSSMTVPPWSRTTSTLTARGPSPRDWATDSTSSAAAIGRAPTWWRRAGCPRCEGVGRPCPTAGRPWRARPWPCRRRC